jgi:hypothetical protein
MVKRLAVFLGIVALLAVAGPVGGQATAPATRPDSDLKIALMDGSLLNGKLSISELTIDTRYGTLKVPVDQVRSFAPGLQSHPQFQQTLNALISDLGADTFAVRERAQQAIVKLGPEIRGELERQVKGTDSERATRLQKIIDDIDAVRSDDEADRSHDWVREDIIVTPGFSIMGRITTPGFSISGSYGTLQVKMEDVREGRRETAEPEDIRKTLSVPGASIAQRAFVNTGIKLAKGDKVTITASGSIVMTPFGGNRQSTPDGATNITNPVQGVNIGTLVGRVGEGPAFIKVGSKFTWTADKAGTFFLGIACPEEYSSYTFPGEYEAKIRVQRK